MADDFVQQIAHLLGQSPEDTERKLHSLADSIREEVENNGTATVEGLGVFRRDGDALAFEPAPSLADAVNHRYAGLLPLDSGPTGAPEQPAPAEPTPEEPTADPFAVPPAASLDLPEEEAEPVRDLASPPEHAAPAMGAEDFDLAEEGVAPADEFEPEEDVAPAGGFEPIEDPEPAETPFEGPEAPAPPDFDEDLDDEVPAGDEAVIDLDDDLAGEHLEEEHLEEEHLEEDLDDEDIDDGSDIDMLLEGVWMPATGATDAPHPLGPTPPEIMEEADFSVMDEDAAEAPVPYAEAGAEPAGPPPASEPPAPPPHTVPAPGFAATAASATRPVHPSERRRLAPLLGVLGAVALAAVAFLWFLNREPAVTTVDEPAAPIAADTAAAIAPPAVPDTGAVAEAAPAEPEPEPELPPSDPLRGSAAIDPAQGGFAWVVASELSREPAERRAAAFREQGYRAGVVAQEAGGRTRYRVALGQFSSLDEANQHRPHLPAGVPADTWLLRL